MLTVFIAFSLYINSSVIGKLHVCFMTLLKLLKKMIITVDRSVNLLYSISLIRLRVLEIVLDEHTLAASISRKE
jgi:hypothetical protein